MALGDDPEVDQVEGLDSEVAQVVLHRADQFRPGQRGRRRDEAVRAAIIEAAGSLLMDVGFQDLTVEGVAARAGASKGTIYKWWPSKGALALDGYSHWVQNRAR